MKKFFPIFMMCVILFSIVGYTAPSNEFVVYENNFDSFTVGESYIGGAIKKYGNADNLIVYAPKEGGGGVDETNKVIKFGDASGNETGFWLELAEVNTGICGKFTVSFDIYFEHTQRSVRLPEFYQNDLYIFEAICTCDLIGASTLKGESKYQSSKALSKHWYNVVIDADTENKTFSVKYDGNKLLDSEFTYLSNASYMNKILFKYMAAPKEAYAYIDNLKVVTYMDSDVLFVDGNNIYGVTDYMTADDAISFLEYKSGTEINIYTKNGLTRNGCLRAGDYLIAETPNEKNTYYFPELSLASIYGDTCNIDTQNMKISGITEGLTAEQLIKSIKGAEGFSFLFYDSERNAKSLTDKILNGDILNIKISSSEQYDFTLNKQNNDNCIVKEDFESDNIENWYGNSIYDAAKTENGAVRISSSANSEVQCRRYFPMQNEMFITEYTLICNYNSDSKDKTVFTAPKMSNESGDGFNISIKNGKLCYSGENGDISNSLEIENGRKYYFKIIVRPNEKSYDLYVNDSMICENQKTSGSMEKINRMEFNSYAEELVTGKNDYMYIDDLRVYNPAPKLGAIIYEEEINAVKLIYSENSYEYPQITKDSVIIEDENGNEIDFSFNCEANACILSVYDNLKDGNYKVVIENKPYYLKVGNTPYEINYTLTEISNNNVKCEYSITNRTAEDKNTYIYFVLYNETDTVTDVSVRNTVLPESCCYDDIVIFPKNEKKAKYMKIFLWDEKNKMTPLCRSYIYNIIN